MAAVVMNPAARLRADRRRGAALTRRIAAYADIVKASPEQTEEERRLIDEWLANPDNYARMMARKNGGQHVD